MKLSDFNKISIETVSKLFTALTDALKELQGGNTLADTVRDNKLFCILWEVQVWCCNRVMEHDRKKEKYLKMDGRKLLREMYMRMATIHHYGACMGRDLKGLSWHIEENGRFALMLGECDLNLEHSVLDIRREDSPNGTLFCIGYDPDIDCDDKDSALFGRYENALNFCCSFKDGDNTETRDLTVFDRYPHREMLRDVLAGIDMIADMAADTKEEKK